MVYLAVDITIDREKANVQSNKVQQEPDMCCEIHTPVCCYVSADYSIP